MIGSSEMIVVLVLALIFFGPKKLPELTRSLGKAMGEYKKALRDFERETQMASMGGEIPLKPLAEKKEETTLEITEIAKNLGIDTKGKSNDQILKEISEKTKKKEEPPKKKKIEKPVAAE